MSHDHMMTTHHLVCEKVFFFVFKTPNVGIVEKVLHKFHDVHENVHLHLLLLLQPELLTFGLFRFCSSQDTLSGGGTAWRREEEREGEERGGKGGGGKGGGGEGGGGEGGGGEGRREDRRRGREEREGEEREGGRIGREERG